MTTYDSSDVHAWSGLGNRIRRALEEAGVEIVTIGPLSVRYDLLFRLKGAAYRRLSTRVYQSTREPLLLRHYARQIERALEAIDCDFVFSPGTIPISSLQTEKPIVFWSDATFDGMLDFYPGSTNLSAQTARDGHRAEQDALSRARVAIYASDWAAESALRHYDVDPSKVKVVPFGANLDSSRTSTDIAAAIDQRALDPVRLLFIGAEWERKRGDFAVQIATLLNERGVRTEVHLVGARPPRRLPPFATEHGFVSQGTEAGRRTFDELLLSAAFLLLPSEAECYGVALAEASSYGVPSLVTRVGGTGTAVHDGVNGQTFDLSAPPERYADFIQDTVASACHYRALALSSFAEYSTRLNWTVAGSTATAIIREACGFL